MKLVSQISVSNAIINMGAMGPGCYRNPKTSTLSAILISNYYCPGDGVIYNAPEMAAVGI